MDNKRRKILLCAIAKNEGPYLAEWAAYHKLIGFDDIIVYDNDSNDDSRVVLEALRASGVLRWKPWPNTGDGRVQKAAYGDCLKSAKADFEWIAFLDIDEFLYMPKFNNSISEFLEAYDHLDAIGVNWSLFGTSHHRFRTDGLVIERFTQSAKTQHSGNRAVKTIARTDSITVPNLHNHAFRAGVVYQTVHGEPIPVGVGKSATVSHDIIRVNHYFTKSEEEWQLKVNRGRATKPDGHPDKLRTREHFDRHNRNEVASTELTAYVEPVLAALQKLGIDRPTAPLGAARLAVSAEAAVTRGDAGAISQSAKSSAPGKGSSPATNSNAGKTSFSQYSEDLIIESLLRRSAVGLRESGVYIDVGACWPVKYSNSYAFYRKGWSGLCIDATPGFAESFGAERPRDVSVGVGVADTEGIRTFFTFENAVFNTFDEARSEKLAASNAKGRSITGRHEVARRPLQAIVDDRFAAAEIIDFASIDVGGRELEVIQSLDLGRTRPYVLAVEAKLKSIEDSVKSRLARHLAAQGYRYVAAADHTMFFAR